VRVLPRPIETSHRNRAACPRAQRLLHAGSKTGRVIARFSQCEIGHAFGNRLSRNTARRHGAKIDSLVLLACGGQIKSPASAHADLLACFDDTLPADAHLETVRRAFFAPGNDPAVWRDGWYKDTAMMQGIAVRNSDHAYWKLAGGKPFLIVQALQDAIAPPPNAHALLEAAPDQVRMIELDGAGHAMLPEKPDEIARIVLERLNERRAAGWR
jgi:pimeloyl-ACP methyl ester carboxylesterase